MGSRLKSDHKFSDSDIATTIAHIDKNKNKVFVHTPYSINIARRHHDDWSVTALQKHLETTRSFGGLGCVLHIGQKANMDINTAQENMRQNVIEVAQTTTLECPLLIETDSGGSLLDNPDDLATWFLSFPVYIQERLGICLDTCHVFAAGYDNLDTLIMFRKAGVPDS